MKISSNRDSACRQCKKEWSACEQIHYDPDTRAVCIDKICFEDQVRKRIEERIEHGNKQSSENWVNLSNEFRLENEEEFRGKIQERLAKYKIMLEESEKFLQNHNDKSVKTSVEWILRDLLR